MGPTRSEGVALESRAAAAPQQPTGPRAPGAASGPRPHPSTSGGDHANVEDVDLDDLNPESLWKFRVKGFGPLLVAMDSAGGSLYAKVKHDAQGRRAEVLARLGVK